MKALYPLDRFVASFDFFNWLVQAKAQHGVTTVVFDLRNPKTNKWSVPTLYRRFESILAPGAMLAGCSVELGTEGTLLDPPYFTGWTKYIRAGGAFERIKTHLAPGKDRYTVTLRRTERSPGRDSDAAVWRAFAKEIGARVIEDYQDEHITLPERLAIYAGARMNFGVCNGPMFLCTLTPYPVAMFAACDSRDMHAKARLNPGEQFPWMIPGTHYLIEDKPTVESLMQFVDGLAHV